MQQDTHHTASELLQGGTSTLVRFKLQSPRSEKRKSLFQYVFNLTQTTFNKFIQI